MEEEKIIGHFLLAGRKCGGCEDTVAYVRVAEDENPESVFIRDILYAGRLSDGWEERLPTYEENSFGDWAEINGIIELPFGVDTSEPRQQAVELTDFLLEEGKLSAKAIDQPEASFAAS